MRAPARIARVDLLARFLINSWEGSIVRMKIVDSREPLDDFFTVAFPLIAGRTIAGLR